MRSSMQVLLSVLSGQTNKSFTFLLSIRKEKDRVA